MYDSKFWEGTLIFELINHVIELRQTGNSLLGIPTYVYLLQYCASTGCEGTVRK